MKWINKALIICFFSITAIILLLFVFPQILPEQTNTEKRDLSEMPSLSIETLEEFPREFESYVNDHFPFRSALIRLNSLFEYRVFNRFLESDVMIGKDDWFFYDPKAAEEANAIRDYKGITSPDETELAQLTTDLENFRDWLADKGISFVIVLSPNKAQIYSEYLPSNVKRMSEVERADAIADYLHANSDLDCVYLKESIMEGKADHPVYLMHDDHWNEFGAYLAANSFVESVFGETIPEPDFTFVTEPGGELAEWANLVEDVFDHNVARNAEPFQYEMTLNGGRFTSREYSPLGQAGDELLFVIGDSFGTDFFPYLTPYYSHISFRRFDNEYGYQDILETQPDVVMLELTERFFTAEVLRGILSTE